MAYSLTYFPARGRAEQIRLLLNLLGASYTENLIGREQFMALKKEGPKTLMFGSLPMLQDGDMHLAQGCAIMGYLARKHGIAPTDLQEGARADAITMGAEDLRTKSYSLRGEDAEAKQAQFLRDEWAGRWLPSFEGLLQLNGNTGFFVGTRITHADIAVWDVLDDVLGRLPGASLEGYPALQAFRSHVQGLPALAEYLKKRA